MPSGETYNGLMKMMMCTVSYLSLFITNLKNMSRKVCLIISTIVFANKAKVQYMSSQCVTETFAMSIETDANCHYLYVNSNRKIDFVFNTNICNTYTYIMHISIFVCSRRLYSFAFKGSPFFTS